MNLQTLIEYAVIGSIEAEGFYGATSGIGYQAGGILPSETFLLYSMMCELAWATIMELGARPVTFIESGRRNGFSTAMLAASLQESTAGRVESIEVTPDESRDGVLRRMFPHKDNALCLWKGDAHRLLPGFVEINAQQGRRIGVLIDGPKGKPAFELAQKIRPHVCFVAMHDVHQVNEDGSANPGFIEAQKAGAIIVRTGEHDELREFDKWVWQSDYSSLEEMTRHGFGLAFLQGGQL